MDWADRSNLAGTCGIRWMGREVLGGRMSVVRFPAWPIDDDRFTAQDVRAAASKYRRIPKFDGDRRMWLLDTREPWMRRAPAKVIRLK